MSDINQTESPVAQSFNRQSQVYQILTLLGLGLLPYGLLNIGGVLSWVWLAGSGVLVAAGLALARRSAAQAIMAARQERFMINDQRLETLGIVKVPDDVLKYLSEIKGKVYVGEHRFLWRLRRSLGNERTREVQSLILKYTRM